MSIKELLEVIIFNLKQDKIRYDDIEFENSQIRILIECGDWKHEHAKLDIYMIDTFLPDVHFDHTEIIKSDDSDCYSAYHYYSINEGVLE